MSERLHGNWVRLYLEDSNSEVLLNLGVKVRRQYLGALKTLSRAVSSQVAQYDIYSMVVGTIMVLEVLALLLLSTPQALGAAAELEVPLSPVCSLLFCSAFLLLWAMHVVVCTSAESSRYLCSLAWPMAGGVLALVSMLLCGVLSALTRTCVDGKLLRRNPTPSSWRWSELDFLILAGTAGHVLSLGASSFIEEEHQTWYFLVSTLCLALCHESYRACSRGGDGEPPRCSGPASALQDRSVSCDMLELDRARKSPSSLDGLGGPEKYMALASPWLVLGCCRLLRSLNQTGVQWAHRHDLGHWLTSSEHQAKLSVLAALSLLAIFALVQSRCSLLSKGALTLGLFGVYCYRTATGHLLSPWQQGSKDLSSSSALRRACFCYALLSSVPVSAYIVLVTALRYHLFIWSVFSPKLLYEGMHLLVTAALCLCFTAADRPSTKADAGRIAHC